MISSSPRGSNCNDIAITGQRTREETTSLKVDKRNTVGEQVSGILFNSSSHLYSVKS